MITVAVITCGSAKIISFKKGLAMYRLTIVIKLAGGDIVFRHVIDIGMTAAAGFRKVLGMGARMGQTTISYLVNRVAGNAVGNLVVAFVEQPLSVKGCFIFGQLVNQQGRVMCSHVLSIRVATSAEEGYF